MNREILFKAKNFLNEWVYGSLVQKTVEGNRYNYFPNCDTMGHMINVGDYYIIDSNGDGWWVREETICQYTLDKDKNGVKIFENDLVCTQYVDPIFHSTFSDKIDYEDKHEIKFDNGCFFVEIKDKVNLLITALNNKIEVIGTIYDKEDTTK